jgi:hypothetical protein
MSYLTLQTDADYTINERCTFDTRDHEDHTFCGVMFGMECQSILPVKFVEVQTIWVRGDLGPLTVWKTPDTYEGKQENETAWENIYEKDHEPSREVLVPLELDPPLRVRPGQKLGLYVHSKLSGDRGLVYDNQKTSITYQDRFIKVLPGVAHKSNIPFSDRGMHHWSAWRPRREFVGRMSFGVKYLLWTPLVATQFPKSFNQMATTMHLLQKRESGLDRLPTEMVWYILNMCKFDWSKDLDEEEDVKAEESEEEEEEEGGRSISIVELLGMLNRMPPAHVAQLVASGQLPPQIVALLMNMQEDGEGEEEGAAMEDADEDSEDVAEDVDETKEEEEDEEEGEYKQGGDDDDDDDHDDDNGSDNDGDGDCPGPGF